MPRRSPFLVKDQSQNAAWTAAGFLFLDSVSMVSNMAAPAVLPACSWRMGQDGVFSTRARKSRGVRRRLTGDFQ